ncbi:MAG: DEAD/DEAH box helicase, partial [Candidatus Heimdallarchaeota archaeon]
MVSSNNVPEVKGSTLPPMKFVCELPPSNNLVANFTWSNSTMELNHLGPILDKYLQDHPYVFQAEAIPKIIQGSDLLITAGTGSGKTEIFLFALIELILQGKITGAIIFYPSKQLVLDQEARLAKYLTWIAEALGKKITYSTYTGDLSNQAIAGIERACPNILLATVDKVFHRILKHQKSAGQGFSEEICDMKNKFFTHIINAKVLVFDEIHVYSGLMLSNIYNYIQLHKAVNPDSRVILSSATISEAESFRNAFLSTAEIISGNPRRGTIQILTLEKQYLEQLNNYITSNFLSPENSFNNRQRVILFNDSISENESFTIQMKKQMSDATGIELQKITEQEQNKIACIHSQLPPARKQNIVSKARDNQLFYLISTDLLAQGVDFPGFYYGIQIGWPITGLTGAIQRIGRIRFEDDLDETRYFIFVFDP